jgi:TrmH family RNA methyltransferase
VLSAREEKEIRALLRRKERATRSRFLAEGVRVLEDLLASDLRVVLVVASSSLEDSARGGALLDRAARAGVPVRTVPDAELDTLAGTLNPQGVLAVAEVPRVSLDTLRSGGTPLALLLDGVQDPGNFGTLVRSAEALGAAGVVALPGTVDPWNPKAVRAAAGSAFRIPVIQASWNDASDWLRAEGYEIVASAAGGEPLGRPGAKVALVVGNEGAGVSENVLSEVDRTVGIPLRGRADSLNVAAAAAILMYELTR